MLTFISLPHHLDSLTFSLSDQQMAICLVNPYAHALQLLMQHLQNTCDCVYYDLHVISDLRALLQDKGHFLAVFIYYSVNSQ